MKSSSNFLLSFVIGPLLLLCFASSAAMGESLRSNLELLTDLSTEVIEELLLEFEAKLEPVQGIALAPHGKDEKYEFLMNVFTTALTANGMKIYPVGKALPADTSGAQPKTEATKTNAMKLEFQAFEFSLTYPKVFRAKLIGGKVVKRKADVKVFAKLLDSSDQSVIWAGEASRSHDDQFDYSARPAVEKGLFSFTKPPIETPRWGRIIEPVVVSGIIVGLVYLFFSNQSDN